MAHSAQYLKGAKSAPQRSNGIWTGSSRKIHGVTQVLPHTPLCMQSTGIILWFHPPKYLYCISSGPSTYLWRKILHLTYGITPDTAQSSSKMLKSFVMTVDNIHIYIYVRLLVDDVLEVRGLKGHECFCLGTDPPSPILLLISPLPHH